jgi:nicotinamidase-related amidase
MASTNTDFNRLCDLRDASVLVVDIQTQLTAAMPVKVLARLQRNAGLLLKSAGLLQIPTYITEQYPQGLGSTESEILKLLPDGANVYEKTTFSAIGADGFLAKLEESGRKQVVLAGMEAHVCVLQSALELLERGYQVFVVADAVCSRQRESYETALLRLRQQDVVICDTESVVFEWLKDSKHAQFKSIQGLLK